MPTPGERLRLLAMLLAVPQEESLEVLTELADRHPWLAAPVEELSTTALAQWQTEHGRLFICGRPHAPCLPFASAQRHGVMCGAATERLAAFYAGIGLEADDMPPDYLGTILECAAHLAETDTPADTRRTLWREHLQPWLPDFAATLARESRLSLYTRLGSQLAVTCQEFGNA